MARRVRNLAEWGRHIVENLRARALRSPDRRLDTFIAELEGYLPPASLGPQHLGFAVPLRLQSEEGELTLITTLTSFATATDVTLAELQLEAFLPADEATARSLEALRPHQPSPLGHQHRGHDQGRRERRPPPQLVVPHPPAEQKGDHRIDEGVGPHSGRAGDPEEPGIGGQSERGSAHDEEPQGRRPPRGETDPGPRLGGRARREHERGASRQLHRRRLRGGSGAGTMASDQ